MRGGVTDALNGGVIEVLVDVIVTDYVQLEARFKTVSSEVVSAELIDDVAVFNTSAPVYPYDPWKVLPWT